MPEMTQEKFQETVLKGVTGLETKFESFQTAQQKLLADYDRLTSETKKTMEEFTLLKNAGNDHAKIIAALQKTQMQMRTEVVLAGMSPIQRISNNPELRERFNIAVRLAMDKTGDMHKLMAPKLKAFGEDTSPGSTLIIAQLAKEIYDTLAEYGSWSTLGVRRLGTKITKYPVKTARAKAAFILTEAGAISDDTNKAGTSIDLEVEIIASLIYVARQLLEDAEFDVTADVLNDFHEAFNLRLDTAVFIGNGTADADNGGFTGVFNGGTKVSAGQGNTTVGTMDFDDILRVLTSVASVVLQRRPQWWLHPQMLVRMLGIKDANKRPIFLSSLEAPSFGAVGTIMGYPVNFVQVAPNVDGAAKQVAAFGDGQSQVVGIRDDFMFEASDEYRWNTLERAFRAYGRAGTITRRADAFGILTTADK